MNWRTIAGGVSFGQTCRLVIGGGACCPPPAGVCAEAGKPTSKTIPSAIPHDRRFMCTSVHDRPDFTGAKSCADCTPETAIGRRHGRDDESSGSSEGAIIPGTRPWIVTDELHLLTSIWSSCRASSAVHMMRFLLGSFVLAAVALSAQATKVPSDPV